MKKPVKKTKFLPYVSLKKTLKHQDHSRLDNIESQPADFNQGEGFLAEMRMLDSAADEALKSHSPTTG